MSRVDAGGKAPRTLTNHVPQISSPFRSIDVTSLRSTIRSRSLDRSNDDRQVVLNSEANAKENGSKNLTKTCPRLGKTVADLLRTPNHRKHMPAKVARFIGRDIRLPVCQSKNRITGRNQVVPGPVLPKALESARAEHFFGCSSLLQFGYGTWTDVLEGNCPRSHRRQDLMLLICVHSSRNSVRFRGMGGSGTRSRPHGKASRF